MTPGRHVTGLTVAGVIILLVALISLGALIVLLRPGRERPADVEPTPTRPPLTVVTDPTPRTVASPTLTATPVPEVILTTPTVTPVPTATVTPTPVPPTVVPMPAETRPAIQKG